MQIISLVPMVSNLIARHGLPECLCAVSEHCLNGKSIDGVRILPKVDAPAKVDAPVADSNSHRFQLGADCLGVDMSYLASLNPTCIFTTVRSEDPAVFVPWAEEYLRVRFDMSVRIYHVELETLTDLYDTIETVGTVAGFAAEARSLVLKIQGQLMQWGHLFYDRCKGKTCLALTDVKPFCVAPRWITDIIELLGARVARDSQNHYFSGQIEWCDISAVRPDVLIFIPQGKNLMESVQLLPTLQALPAWEELPAVKRGEVGFCDGGILVEHGALLRGAAIIVSIIARLESGYITPRNSYHKLRYVELHRHKFL